MEEAQYCLLFLHSLTSPPTHVQVRCVSVCMPIHQREREDRGHVCTQRLCSTCVLSLEYCHIWGQKKGKNGHIIYIAYLANFQKKLIIINYAYIDTSTASQKQYSTVLIKNCLHVQMTFLKHSFKNKDKLQCIKKCYFPRVNSSNEEFNRQYYLNIGSIY